MPTVLQQLSGDANKQEIFFGIRIEGIRKAFVEQPTSAIHTTLGTDALIVVTDINEGKTTLNLEERREQAATLQIELLDDDSLSLQSLFASATERTTYVSQAETAASTSIDVGSSTLIASAVSAGGGSCDVYVHNETLLCTNAAANVLTVTRARYDSKATAMFGDSAYDDGDPVYLTPAYWVGRRVKLYAYSSTGTESLIGTYIIDSNPTNVDGRTWQLNCAGVSQEYWERTTGFNIEPIPVMFANSSTVGSEIRLTYTCAKSNKIRTGGTFPSYVLIENNDGTKVIWKLVSTSGADFTVVATPLFGTQFPRSIGSPKTVKQIGIIGASGGAFALNSLLLSREGQEATSIYDCLAGRLPVSFDETGWSLGAGFDISEVDTDAFVAAGIAPPEHTFIIDKERPLKDFLRQFGWLSNCCFTTDVDGKLTAVNLGEVRDANATTLTANDIIATFPAAANCDESSIYPMAQVEMNYNPLLEEYQTEINLIDVDLLKRYPRQQNRRKFEFGILGCSQKILSKATGFAFNHPSDASIADRVTSLAKILRSTDGIARTFGVAVSLKFFNLRIGSIVKLSSASLPTYFSQIPDFKGGFAANVLCRIIERKPAYKSGEIELTLQMLTRTLRASPACAIASVTAPNIINLNNASPESSGASPANDFYVGAGIRVYDPTSGLTEKTTISAINSGTQLTTTLAFASWSFNPAINPTTRYIVLDPDTSGSGTTVSGYDLVEIATLTNDSGTNIFAVSSGQETKPRWK
jgi:hypothetical protein